MEQNQCRLILINFFASFFFYLFTYIHLLSFVKKKKKIEICYGDEYLYRQVQPLNFVFTELAGRFDVGGNKTSWKEVGNSLSPEPG